MKKRGHGVNYLNGFGGKLQPRETPLDATVRELREESGLRADPSAIEPTGILTVMGSGKPMVIYLSRCLSWQETPEETEEMQPAWFTVGHSSQTEHSSTTCPWRQCGQMTGFGSSRPSLDIRPATTSL